MPEPSAEAMSLENTLELEEQNLEDKYLRLEKKSIRKHIVLPPKFLGDLKKGIENELFRTNQEVLNDFGGFPISIGKISLLQNVGSCLDDHAFIDLYVNLDCVVFKPKVGKRVRAIVHKIADTYIGCLICGKINATVFKKEDPAGGWEPGSQEMSRLQVGQSVLIKIKSIKNQHSSMFITATFEKII